MVEKNAPDSMPDYPRSCSVSVVIPTRERPAMVLAAVHSALAQTCAPREVIVVIDGPESCGHGGTPAMLAGLNDERLRVVALPGSVGGAEARNIGVSLARGEWIAFLDDDDLWLPGKLAVQLAYAGALPAGEEPVLSCRVLARSPEWEEVWPRHCYQPGQHLAEYLFCRRGWRYGSALLQTSTLLARRALLLRVPFTPGLRKHQDWDWLLRVAADPSVAIHCVGTEPLAIFHVEGDRTSVSRSRDWRASLAWARERRMYYTGRAFRSFLMTECAAQAQGEPWLDRWALLVAIFRSGLPRGGDLLRAAVFLLIPQTTRRRLRERVRKLRQPFGSAIAAARTL